MKKKIPLCVIVLPIILAACNLTRSVAENPVSTSTSEQPASQSASSTPATLQATSAPTTQAQMPIVYYYFVAVASKSAPAGSVVILPNELILGPTLSDIARSPDPVTNIGSALRAMIRDPRNAWTSKDFSITSVSFKDGAANVTLQGEILGAGNIVLIAARQQIVLTVFAEEAVQTATITLNGENIANLGVSRSSEAKPAGTVYTRADVETFLADNAYSNPP